MSVAGQILVPPCWPANSDWTSLFKEYFLRPEFRQLIEFVDTQRKTVFVFPPPADVFNAFRYTSMADTRVVILGQDPYHGAGQAHGLAFSVPKNTKLPPSLRNIFKELIDDLGHAGIDSSKVLASSDLTSWATQGVLLLNTVLTVEEGKANSHQKKGWESFTDLAINLIGQREERVVFILWGKPAATKKKFILDHHVIIESSHPSPLSAFRGFFGSRPFSVANDALVAFGHSPIDWLRIARLTNNKTQTRGEQETSGDQVNSNFILRSRRLAGENSTLVSPQKIATMAGPSLRIRIERESALMNRHKLPSQKKQKKASPFFAAQTSAAQPSSVRSKSDDSAGKADETGRGNVGAESNKRSRKNRVQKPNYRLETLRPIVCLSFVAPLLLFYEIGSIFLDDPSGKSGIDQWMHWMLDTVGFGHLVILPILTAAILIWWHHRLNDAWQIRPTVLMGMSLESVGLGMILFFAANAFHRMMTGDALPFTLAIHGGDTNLGWWSNTISYVGCGVYEEFVFRLIMLNGLIALMYRIWGLEKAGKIIGMLATSLLFAALHYNFFNPAGAEFDINSFMFRFLASMVFCVLFLFRGFGIAVGTHAIYDVLTQV